MSQLYLSKRRDAIQTFGEYFMYAIVVLWLSTEMFVGSNLEYILWWERDAFNHVVAILVLVLLMIQLVLFQRYSKRDIFIMMILTFFILLSTLHSGYNIMLSTWMIIFASKNIKIDRLATVVFWVLFVSIIWVFILYQRNIIDESTLVRNGLVRHSWGFVHPNYLGIQFFHMLVCGLYIRRKKIGIIDYLTVIVGGYFLYRIPNSQSSYYALGILLVLIFLYKISEKKPKLRTNLINTCFYLVIFVNLGSIALSTHNIRGNKLLMQLNKFLSSRFTNCYNTYMYYGNTLWGQPIKTLVSRPGRYIRFYLDNGYMAILLRYGICIYLIFSACYILAMLKLKRDNNLFLEMILTVYAIYGVMENNFFSLSQNIFLVVISCVIFTNTAYPVTEASQQDGR